MLRYVDPDTNQVQEDLISFFECDEGITGRCLAKKITDSLESFGLDLGKLRGQSYDGTGNMAGRVRGTAALISAQYPLALYLHCASHALNLAATSNQRSKHDWGCRQGSNLFFCSSKKATSFRECYSCTSARVGYF